MPLMLASCEMENKIVNLDLEGKYSENTRPYNEFYVVNVERKVC